MKFERCVPVPVGNLANQGGFSGAIGADNGVNFAALYLKVHRITDGERAERFAQVFDLENRAGHDAPLRVIRPVKPPLANSTTTNRSTPR